MGLPWTLPGPSWQSEPRVHRTRDFLKTQWRQKGQLSSLIARMRIGQHGLRPFGSKGALSLLASQSKGARISKAPTDQGHPKVPLQEVYHRLKVWLNNQYSRGLEPRPSTILARCELELATEIGTQRALQRVAPNKFQEYVLEAAKHRLQALQE